MEELIAVGVVFFGAYHIIKLFSTHLLKRKLIKAEQYDRVGILEEPKVENDESNRYPSLKWGLVALMTGLGFIIIEVMGLFNRDMVRGRDAVLPLGILMVCISLGFLIYFFIMNGKAVKK
ncbi:MULTISPECIES: DUF6249 domain-containing protein [Draconibacterium]|uniref:DUF6249 domain-containing protein n=1 Tax=Draconibacterium sediminis TaxID=1544798 RepID=A0A0D8JDW8_9BACT|nr:MULTISPECIES: DUF6249 domain-containing protein [Draconibacterium]KJF44934.1 hypothetical protein LH29_05790 [Draconibacterium sediminis]